MSARQSAACAKALRLVARGVPPIEAAKRAGVNKSTIYRALSKLTPKEQP